MHYGTLFLLGLRRHDMASEAQKKAIRKYKEKVKRFTLEFSPAEQDMLDHLNAQAKKQTYIKALIRADMAKNK